MGWIVVVCESHRLDGVHFVAAHFHIAMQSRRVLRFLRPEDEARTRALAAALEGLTLAEATNAFETGRVIDERTGVPARWEPAAMVLPVSERLHALLGGPELEARVDEAMERFRFRVVADLAAP